MELRYGKIDENVRKRSVQDVILHEKERYENKKGAEKSISPEMTSEKTAVTKTQITGTRITGTKMTGTRMTGTRMTGTRMTGTQMTGTQITGTQMTGTRITGNHITDASMMGKSVTEILPFCRKMPGALTAMNAVNRLAADGCITETLVPAFLLPPGTQEEELRALLRQVCRTALPLGVSVQEGCAEVTEAVSRPVVISTAAGRFFPNIKRRKRGSLAGMDIVMAGFAGMEGTYILVTDRREELQKRFPEGMLYRMEKAGDALCVLPAAKAAAGYFSNDSPSNVLPVMVQGAEGGIFAAFWELCSKTGCGMEVDLQEIPILQETIEITDYYNINPYAMHAGGSLLIAAENGDQTVRMLERAGIYSRRIGRLTGTKDRILRNREEIRFLDRPQADVLSDL